MQMMHAKTGLFTEIPMSVIAGLVAVRFTINSSNNIGKTNLGK